MAINTASFNTARYRWVFRILPGRRALFTLVFLVSSFGLLVLYALSQQSYSRLHSGMSSRWHTDYTSPLPGAEEFANAVANLWKPYIHDVDVRNYTTKFGKEYTIDESRRHWDKPLGKDVLILDVDTRLDDPGHASVLQGDNLTPRRAGRLNHYIYSLIHGYDYRLMHAPKFWYRHQTWVKVPMMREALKKYKFVVFLDSDAIFVEPQVPLEWLMDLWDIKDNTLAAMPIDRDHPSNYDSKGQLMWNTGFVITQQSQRTDQMFESWVNCPSDEEFPGCSFWEYNWAHEQAAFANYIRYQYNASNELIAIPSNDANGSPYIPDNATCGGAFVSDYWHSKDRAIADLRELVADGLTRQMQDGRGGDLFFNAFANEHPIQS